MRTRSQPRNNFPQQEASSAIVEPLRIELPFLEDQFQEDPLEDPLEVSMADNRTMAELLQPPTFARQLEAELNANINWNVVIKQFKRRERLNDAVMKYQALKRKPLTEAQARKNMIIYLKNMARYKMNYFKGMTYIPEKEVEVEGHKREVESLEKEITKKQKIDEEAEELKSHLQIVSNDVYTKATPLALKIPIVDYKIHLERNKPYLKIIRADGNHMLFLSFSTLLKNFNREDLESLWKLVKEMFEKIESKNYTDDYLLKTLKTMFEQPDVETHETNTQEKDKNKAKNDKIEHGTEKIEKDKVIRSQKSKVKARKSAKVDEVLEVVTAAKLINEVVTTTGVTTTAEATKVSVPRRRRGVVIQDSEETTSTVVVHSELSRIVLLAVVLTRTKIVSLPAETFIETTSKTLADLGASINLMPLSVWGGLSLLELTPTCITLELTDHSVSKPICIAKDVSVKVGVFHFPSDFVVVDFEPDPRVPLILERCFLKTGQALINVHKGELTLRIGNEAITYNLDQTSRYSANYNQMMANKIDVIDMACEEYSQEFLGFSDVTASGNPTPYDDSIVSTTSLTLTPFGDSDFLLFEEADTFLGLEDDPNSSEFNQFYYDPEGDILLLETILNSEPLPPLPNHEQY
nr:reverse transcriptase domain-containing protein [Tanacetum cinerariifolium]